MEHADLRKGEPTYVNDLGDLRTRDIPPQARQRPRPRRYEDDFGPKRKAGPTLLIYIPLFINTSLAPRPRRNTYRESRPHRPYSSSESSSPPPPRPRHHREPRPRDVEDDYPPRRRRHREEDYFSDNRHNRPRRRDPYDDPLVKEKSRDREPGRERPGAPERKGSRWQKEGERLFKEYAVPALKAEGAKIVTKGIGNLFAKGVSA